MLGVHAALGAGPAQVAVQMLVEALLIALAGALVGLWVAATAINYIETTLSGHWGYYWMAVRFEWGVVLFTLALAVLTVLVSGVMPALRLRRTVGEDESTYHYERDIEQFFRHSPAIVRDHD